MVATAKRIVTGFEGTTEPDTTLGGGAELLDNQTGALGGILRSGSGLTGSAGLVQRVGVTESSLDYRAGNVSPPFLAAVSGAEVYFRPLEGSGSAITGGSMPGMRLTMSWEDGVGNTAILSLDLDGGAPGDPFNEALVQASADTAEGVAFDSYDVTAHDWYAWHRLTWAPSGNWELATAVGGVLASGNLPQIPESHTDALGLRVVVRADNYFDGSGAPGEFNGAGGLVDNLAVWIAGAPAVRLYPRDDGRGMSSASRHWPAPKSARIIGRIP